MCSVKAEWRSILGGDYEVSTDGVVRRATEGRKTWPGRVMRNVIAPNGYAVVAPTVNGKNRQMYVHRIVAAAFLGECPDGMEVNHIDGNKANPSLANLEYVTHARNGQHASRSGLLRTGERHPQAKLSDADVLVIRSERKKGTKGSVLARRFGVSGSTICQIYKGDRRTSCL